jgi:hypothetical protein
MCLSLACHRPGAGEDIGEIDGFQPLIDRFSPAKSVVVVPDRFWEISEDQTAWIFRGYANLVCHIDRAPDGPLVVVVEPTDETSQFHFMVTWDGHQLWTAARRLANPSETIEIPPEQLTPGLHRLEIRRIAAADDPEHRSIRINSFSSVTYRVGEAQSYLEPADADRFEFVRAFLEDGVTGEGDEKFGGWLTSGSDSTVATIISTEDQIAAFDLVSFGPAFSRFSLIVDNEEYAVEVSEGSQRLEVELAEGTHRLEFSVRGQQEGYYLWGAPSLRPARPGFVGPVIVVTMDTTRWDALSLYGGPAAASPNIARLAERATVFENAWSTSPWTLPSHASIFTGLYPSHHGAGVTSPRLDRQFVTLAEIFRRAGYRTAGFAGGELSASHWGVAQGFEIYRDPEGFETRGDRLTDAVERFLDGAAREPFFLFANYFDPHGLYRAPDEFEKLFAVADLREKIQDAPLWGELSRGDSRVWRNIIAGEAEVTPEAVAYLRAAYLAEVAFMDHQVGRLVEWLEDHELFEPATIVLVADHGEFLGEQGFFSHACRLEPELTRIPLIIKWPNQKQPGREQALVSQVDLFMTLAAIADPSVSAGDGLSLGRSLSEGLLQRTAVFMEEHEMRIHPLFDNMRIAPSVFGIQQPSFRQVVWRGGSSCYRQRGTKWSEVGCEVEWRERIEQLEAFIEQPIGGRDDADDAGMSLEMRRRLEALGYVQ